MSSIVNNSAMHCPILNATGTLVSEETVQYKYNEMVTDTETNQHAEVVHCCCPAGRWQPNDDEYQQQQQLTMWQIHTPQRTYPVLPAASNSLYIQMTHDMWHVTMYHTPQCTYPVLPAASNSRYIQMTCDTWQCHSCYVIIYYYQQFCANTTSTIQQKLRHQLWLTATVYWLQLLNYIHLSCAFLSQTHSLAKHTYTLCLKTWYQTFCNNFINC